jgi:type II secretory ATPase GspE/PulE/Tfp pilus assembly ATPase PilB-like protein
MPGGNHCSKTVVNKSNKASTILKLIEMKLSKSLLQAMLIAVAAGTISSCKKPADEVKKPAKETEQTKTTAATDGCPACGMG